jgi:hypothetical protein
MNKVTIKLKNINGRRQVPRKGKPGYPGLLRADEVSMLEVVDIDGTIHSTYIRTAPVDKNRHACYSCALNPQSNRTIVAGQICRKIYGCHNCTTIFERIEDSLERL